MDLFSLFSPLWAVHISDGFLTPAWWLGGWGVAGCLLLLGAWRVEDRMIPRIALLTAAFFVTSLIHVPVPGGPKTHLLLSGLLGIILGRHAALAIPVGLFLQAALFGHGGYSTLGVNACVMTLPALLAWVLFVALARVARSPHPWVRTALVMASFAIFLVSAVYAFTLLLTNPLTEVEQLDTSRASYLVTHPAFLAVGLLLAALAARLEARLENDPEFPLGLLLGQLAVLVTLLLNSLVLLLGGEADWHTMVLLTCLLHLPLAVIEGAVTGFTVAFLARVKPDMLWEADEDVPPASLAPQRVVAPGEVTCSPPVLLLVVGLFALWAPETRAHALDAEYRVDRDKRQVTVESWFESGDSPKMATVKVRRADGTILKEGSLDEKGLFRFDYEVVEPLEVIITAPGGHRKELQIPATALGGESPEPAASFADRGSRIQLADILAGVALLLALAAFVLSLRNARALEGLREVVRRQYVGAPPTVSPGQEPTQQIPPPGEDTIRLDSRQPPTD